MSMTVTRRVATRIALGAGALVALLALGGALAASPASSKALDALQWRAEMRNDGRVQLDLRTDDSGGHWWSSNGVALDEFQGLTRSDFRGDRREIQFALVRDAGRIEFEGRIGDGEGNGTARFVPDAGYRDMMRQRGVRNMDEERQYAFFVHDVSRTYIQELMDIGHDPWKADELLAFRIHGVDADYIREMGSLGIGDLDNDELLAFKIHGVTPEFVRETRAEFGEGLDADKLLAMRIHGVTPEMAREARAEFRENLDVDELVAMQIHGVTPEMAREARAEFGQDLDVDELLAMRIHGVTPEFIREVRSLGYDRVDLDDLVAMKIHGVTPAFIKSAQKRYGRDVSIKEMLEMKILGHRGRDWDGEDI